MRRIKLEENDEAPHRRSRRRPAGADASPAAPPSVTAGRDPSSSSNGGNAVVPRDVTDGRAINSFDLHGQVGFLLRKAYQRHIAIFQEHCPVQEITSVQIAVLGAVAKLGPTSLSAIGRLAALDPATTRGVVDRLQDKGMVSIAPDTIDRRQILVRLELKGQQILPRLLPTLKQITALTVQGLNAAEYVALVYLLHKISGGDPADPDQPAPWSPMV